MQNGTCQEKMDIGQKGLHKSNVYWMTEFKKGIMDYFEKCKTYLSCQYEEQFVENVVSKVTNAIDLVPSETSLNQTIPDFFRFQLYLY